MRDMMVVLAQYVINVVWRGFMCSQLAMFALRLKDINGHKRAGDDNITIAENMQHLIEETAVDIKSCANSCDTYAKTSIVLKVLLSGSWGDDFKKYTERFMNRRGDFVLALSIYTGQAVNAANDKLDTVNDKLDTANISVGIVNAKYV